jgi:hypothetical protein
MRTSALVRITGGLAACLLGLTLLGTAPAIADEPPLPIVVDDTVTLYPGQLAQLNVLANDTSPSGDDLALCRFPESDLLSKKVPAVMVSDVGFAGETGDLGVIVAPRARGTHVIDYYVCDHTHLVPAHLTVEVKAVAPVVVHKVAGKPGRLRVTNRNDRTIRFWYGDPTADDPDGRVKVGAGETRTVRVQRHRIAWMALIGVRAGKASMFTSPGIADMGIVRDIKLKGEPLPKPKKPDLGDIEDVLGRWQA